MAIKNYETSISVIDFEDYSKMIDAELMRSKYFIEGHLRSMHTYPKYDMMTIDGSIYNNRRVILEKPEPTRTVYLDEMLSEYES